MGDLFPLLAILVPVLIAVLVSVLALVLVVILGTVGILIVHNLLPSSLIFAGIRYHSMPVLSGLILGFKQKTGKQPGKYGHSNSSGSCFQTSGEDS